MKDLTGLLREHWGLDAADTAVLDGGMNSQTWTVECPGGTFVAKRVAAADVDGLVAGAEAAATLADAGLVTGAPVPTLDGRRVLAEQGLALLEHVPGRELEGESDEEQRWIAEALARVHVAGEPVPGLPTAPFMSEWLMPGRPGVIDHAWLPPVLDAVHAETDALPVTWSLVHTDPAPEAFIHDDGTGVTGLIDWSGARRGPVLYDVASAVMYLGGADGARAFLAAYDEHGPLVPGEMDHLDSFRRLRWAVQATYFASRLEAHDLTGIEDQAGNEKGLADARAGLAELGVPTW